MHPRVQQQTCEGVCWTGMSAQSRRVSDRDGRNPMIKQSVLTSLHLIAPQRQTVVVVAKEA